MVLTAESAPALLLAYLFAGLLSAFLPSGSIRWLGRRGPLSQAGRGMMVGLPFPICSCGVVPLYPSPVAVLLFAALGFPTYVCAASATPLVAALLAAGLSPGAGIAFLITGPATNLSTLGLLSSLHGRRTAIAFAAVLVAFAVAAGLAIDVVFGKLDEPTLAELTEEAPSTLQFLATCCRAVACPTVQDPRGRRRPARYPRDRRRRDVP
jgi:uncharacterized membrane protein YraQ (UPF0718 family)